MFRALVVTSLLAAPSFAFGVACSSSSETVAPATTTIDASPAADDAASVRDAAKEASAACALEVQTNVAVCDECLQKNCCVVINECFTNRDCEDLNTCYVGCAKKPGDAGASCVKECVAAHQASSQNFLDMLECQNTSCSRPCKG